MLRTRAFAARILRTALSILPVSLRKDVFRVAGDYVPYADKHGVGFSSVEGALELAKRSGFDPRTIVDIGAYVGDWSRMARRIFGDVPIVMIDGNPENDISLRSAAAELSNASYFIALLGPEKREEVTLFQNKTGTSVLRELTTLKTTQVSVPMRTLDSLVMEERVSDPVLLKLDVQGFELEVLRGAANLLRKSELVLLEVSTLPFNQDAPLFAEVISFMAERGFVVFDFCGQSRRHSDHALFQIDVLFATENSPLRRKLKFWSYES